MFQGRELTKNIAVIAVMSALLVAGKFALSWVPNVEIVTPLIILFSVVFGFRRSIFAVVIFCLLDNILYPPSYVVAIQYFFHWPLLCVLANLIKKFGEENEILFVALAALMAILFWLETPVLNAVFQISPFLPTLVSGIPFMLPMLLSNVLVVLFVFKPAKRALMHIYSRLFPQTNEEICEEKTDV